MANLDDFCTGLANTELQEFDRAIGLLWYLTDIDGVGDCKVSELVNVLHDQEFPKPNLSRLAKKLRDTKYTVRGQRKGSFRINRTCNEEVTKKYSPFLKKKNVPNSSSILDFDEILGTRTYLEKLVVQINGSYDSGFYDATAVLSRRLMEILIIEVYVLAKRDAEVKDSDNNFLGLDVLTKRVKEDFSLGRNMPRYMKDIKDTGDTAAHHRSYITKEHDIDVKVVRKVVHELLILSGLVT